jgi:hypothetical protein
MLAALRLHDSPHFRLLMLVLFALQLSCGGLPRDFASLPLEEQVTAYERHFAEGGLPLELARSYISLHGMAAARAMSEFVDGHRHGLPPMEAVKIIHLVQLRGCHLRGTPIEDSIRRYSHHHSLSDADRLSTLGVLRDIERDVEAEVDSLGPGECGHVHHINPS